MVKLKPIGTRFSEAAHKKILVVAAKEGLSKSEWIRRLVLSKIGMKQEIDMPRTQAGYEALELINLSLNPTEANVNE